MKRSEMVDLLESNSGLLLNNYDTGIEIDGDAVLTLIEEAGMLPPLTESRQFDSSSKTIRLRQWEPEDEGNQV